MDVSDQSPPSDSAPRPENDQIILRMATDQIDLERVRRYLAARRWRENHIADASEGYPDPTYRSALRTLGNLRAPHPAPTAVGA